MAVPFFRPDLGEAEIDEVVATLRSGWLTTGPRARRFEAEFAAAVGARFAVALNSGTAALHLAVEALGLRAGRGVLVPTMTFAASAEIVRYLGAVPILVDCDPVTGNLDLVDAARKLAEARSGTLAGRFPAPLEVVGIVPVHVGGLMVDPFAVRDFAERERLFVVEDAAHSFPAGVKRADGSLVRCGEGTAAVSCFSFYANKTITTGEGGMATTDDRALAERMRIMSLHGLSSDAADRYSGGKVWDYRILAPGFKYNLTDVAAAIGIHQLARAPEMRDARERHARAYTAEFDGADFLETPPDPPDRLHSWHLYPVRLRLDRLRIDRAAFVDELRSRGIGTSVHWRPLHLHRYYEETFGVPPEALPAATALWPRLLTLPLFPSMTEAERREVVAAVREIGEANGV